MVFPPLGWAHNQRLTHISEVRKRGSSSPFHNERGLLPDPTSTSQETIRLSVINRPEIHTTALLRLYYGPIERTGKLLPDPWPFESIAIKGFVRDQSSVLGSRQFVIHLTYRKQLRSSSKQQAKASTVKGYASRKLTKETPKSQQPRAPPSETSFTTRNGFAHLRGAD